MKRSIKSVVLVMALASGCALCACKKNNEETEKVKDRKKDAPVATFLSSEETEPEEEPLESTAATTIDLNLSDYQIEIAKPPVETNADGSPKTQPVPERLGYGNFCNGSLAAGNKDYHFFVVHPEKHIVAIEMEKLLTGQSYFIYSPAPVKEYENELDMLTLHDKYLYFRENQTKLKRIDLTDYSVADIAEGNITRLIPYNDSLYIGKDSSIVRCDLDGSNEKVVYTAQFKDHPVEISFCINDDKILLSDPKEERDDGLVYGKIYSMDLDGKNMTEILPDVIAGNDSVFFSDGENLYFYGEMKDDPDMKKLTDPDMEVRGNDFISTYEPHPIGQVDPDKILSGFFCVKLDGSEKTFIQTYPAGSINAIDGMIFWTAGNTIFMAGDNNDVIKTNVEGIFDVDDIEDHEIVIVGDWMYYSYIDPEGSGEGRTRKRSLRSQFVVDVDWPAYPKNNTVKKD